MWKKKVYYPSSWALILEISFLTCTFVYNSQQLTAVVRRCRQCGLMWFHCIADLDCRYETKNILDIVSSIDMWTGGLDSWSWLTGLFEKKAKGTNLFLYASSVFAHWVCPEAARSDRHCTGSWPTPETQHTHLTPTFMLLQYNRYDESKRTVSLYSNQWNPTRSSRDGMKVNNKRHLNNDSLCFSSTSLINIFVIVTEVNILSLLVETYLFLCCDDLC